MSQKHLKFTIQMLYAIAIVCDYHNKFTVELMLCQINIYDVYVSKLHYIYSSSNMLKIQDERFTERIVVSRQHSTQVRPLFEVNFFCYVSRAVNLCLFICTIRNAYNCFFCRVDLKEMRYL